MRLASFGPIRNCSDAFVYVRMHTEPFRSVWTNLEKIAKKEQGNISAKALRIIAQVSEGSVRDGISLLDRAITYQSVTSKNHVDDEDIRSMLGLADKTKVIKLLYEVFKGSSKDAISILKELF